MAMEEFDGKAEQKNVENTTPQPSNGIDPAIQRIIDLQQAQIDALKGQIVNSSGDTNALAIASAVSAAVSPLYDRMSAQDVVDKDTGQFNFAKRAALASDPDDALPKEEQVSFASYMSFNVITSDLRNGIEIPAPIKPIKFIYDSSKRIPRGKDTEMVHLCIYTCRSRKELKWLREHTCFNVTFFDNIKGAIAEEAKTARKMSNLIMQLRGMNVHELLSMAQANELTNFQGLEADDLRATIAYQMAKKQQEAEVSNQMKMLNETRLEQELLS